MVDLGQFILVVQVREHLATEYQQLHYPAMGLIGQPQLNISQIANSSD